jgi:serine/threonine protein kinase
MAITDNNKENGLDDQTVINAASSKPVAEEKPLTNKLSAGDLLDERFEIVSLVGKGGMCVVYKAINLRMSQVCAVKMLHTHLNLDDEAQQRFQREAIAASSLQHPNIIGLIAYGFRGLCCKNC